MAAADGENGHGPPGGRNQRELPLRLNPSLPRRVAGVPAGTARMAVCASAGRRKDCEEGSIMTDTLVTLATIVGVLAAALGISAGPDLV